MCRRTILVLCSLAAAGAVALAVPAGASTPVTTKAADWLVTQQQPHGGFEVAGFPGFETPDAVRALAEQAQADDSWSANEARAAILEPQTPLGTDPLDNIDDLAEAGLAAGPAAKVVVLVTNPLAIDPSTFDPSCDGNPVDLEAAIGTPDPAGFFPPQAAFNGTLFAAIAKDVLDGSVPANTVTYIRNAQRTDGGWNFSGTTGMTEPASDVDTTGLALIALTAAGITNGDTDFDAGVGYLTTNQQASGAWQSFGQDDPNSTSVAVLGLTAAGFDDTDTEIQDAVAWLDSQQAPDGHIISPNDSFPPVNTFATSQTILALLRSDVPAASTFDPVLCWLSDAMVRTKTGTYTEPKVKQSRPAGKTATFFVEAANAAAQPDRLVLSGPGSEDGFSVIYRDGDTDVSAAVTAGTYVTPTLDAGESVELKVKVTIDGDVPPGARRTIGVVTRSYADPTKSDLVKAVTKVT
jgi:Squalene-hopene cyclase C-terminal domain/Prenyltransferase and squalene oxidase repeat